MNLFGIWIRYGVKRGWINHPYCITHDGYYEYLNEEEKYDMDEGGDPCHTVVSILKYR